MLANSCIFWRMVVFNSIPKTICHDPCTQWCQKKHDTTLLFPPFHGPLNNDAPSPAYPFLCLCVRSMLSLEMGNIVYKVVCPGRHQRVLISEQYTNRDADEEEANEEQAEHDHYVEFARYDGQENNKFTHEGNCNSMHHRTICRKAEGMDHNSNDKPWKHVGSKFWNNESNKITESKSSNTTSAKSNKNMT